ncbi:hypothetical protein Y032_0044g961 [Ancylostoma ceylanicum]|uniref:Reverse transcriptase domain-containing protein n=2 Tax=Ancylostoma ceylanicum TaxID=53326 RepID=A0A016UEU7_9BILA|nr:hypothetical protein Y032_0044g961 [Ancylostoma ceylanicum]
MEAMVAEQPSLFGLDNLHFLTPVSPLSKACDKVKRAITTVVKPRLGAIVAKQLLDSHPTVPTFYSLVKTQKLSPASDLIAIPPETIKIRPIISSCGGPSDRLSWLLVKVLSPLLQFVGAHIVNVESFLASLSQCQIPSTAYYASFDVASLYTNVNNDNAVDAVISLYEQHESQIHSMGFNANDIRVMLSATLSCNIFCFNNKMYEQKRGLAMGNRIAPLLAIIFMDHIERITLTSDILLYKRYVDDAFVIGISENEVERTLERLNAVDDNISFTMEKPDEEGFLPFLNAKIRIVDGQIECSWYKKSASRNILVHSRSAHPIFVKANMVRNFLKTKEKLCTTTNSAVEGHVSRILEENGYHPEFPRTWLPHSNMDGLPLVLPYVGDASARRVNQAVKNSRLPVRLIFLPPPTLKDLLTSTRIYESKCLEANCRYCTEKKICELRGTVYMIICAGCGEKYIGETMRPLRRRLDEHRRALANPASYPSESFSRHRTLKHTTEPPPAFTVRVLHRHLTRTLERKIMEAREIRRHEPEINTREELREVLRLIA